MGIVATIRAVLILSLPLALLPASGAAEGREERFSALERRGLLTTAFASEALVSEIERAGWAPVLVSFEVPEVAPRLPGRRYEARREHEAIAVARRQILESLGTDGFRIRHRYRSLNAFAGGINARGLVRLFAHRERVVVELDRGGTGQLAEAVPLVKLDAVQSLPFTGRGVTVGVLDTGLDTDHPDLMDDVVAQQCFCSGCCPGGSGSAEDDHGHGTNVTGIVTSAGGSPTPLGGAPDAGIVAVKVADANNTFLVGDLIAGLNYIADERPDVDLVNLSLGTVDTYPGECDGADLATLLINAPIESLRSDGVLSFASSGDNGSGTEMPAPACLSSVVSVGAVYDTDLGSVTELGCTDQTTQADQVACWSSSNSTMDLLAPGAPITSTGLGGGTSTFFGTSQSAPLAAACAAVLLEANPSSSPDQIATAMLASSTRLTDPKNGLEFPRLDCLAALSELMPTPVPALEPPGVAAAMALLLGAGLRWLRNRPRGEEVGNTGKKSVDSS